jgi:PAS domain S-box-containing protein
VLCEDGKSSSVFPCQEGLDSSRPTVLEYYNSKLDKHIEVRVIPRHDAEWKLEGFVHITRDITERVKTEETLRLLEKAVNTTRTGITFRDTNNVIRYINPADAAMHGYSPEELIGKKISVLVKPRKSNPLGKDRMKALGSWARESLNVRKDGSEFPVYLVSDIVRDPMGEPEGIITISEDITERKKAEDELRKLSNAVSQSPVSVVITDTEGNIEYVNPKFTELTGYSYEEALGKNPRIRCGRL